MNTHAKFRVLQYRFGFSLCALEFVPPLPKFWCALDICAHCVHVLTDTHSRRVIAEIVQLEYPLRHTISWSTKHLWAWITITIEGVLVLKLILLCCMPLESYSKEGMGLEMEADHVTTRRFTVWVACSLKCRCVTLALHLSNRKSLVLKYICGQYSAAVCNTVYCALIRDHRSLDQSPLLAMVSCL